MGRQNTRFQRQQRHGHEGLSFLLLLAGCLMLLFSSVLPAQGKTDPTVISVNHFFRPNDPSDSLTAQLIDLMRQDPGLRIEAWGGISLPGGFGRSSLTMSFAGGTAPDLLLTFFHGIRSDIDQGFLMPLNEWIGHDLDGDGQVSPEEAIWDGWANIPPLWRQVATVDGKIYALPLPELHYVGILYRKDLVRAAGLNPDQPPETWDEFFTWAQRLTFPNKEIPGAQLARGQRGMFLTPISWLWLPWMQAAGGSPLVQYRRSPATGVEYEFPMQTLDFRVPETGEDLASVAPRWQASFSSPAGQAAASFYHRMVWAPWIMDPETGQPVNLSKLDVAQGQVTSGDRTLTFAPNEVIRGVVRTALVGGGNQIDQFARGEVAMMQWFDRNMEDLVRQLGVPAEMLGIMPIPAMNHDHRPVFQIQRHFAALSSQVASRPKEERDRAWKSLLAITSEDARDRAIRQKALLGGAMWCHPADLKRMGLLDYLHEVPEAIRSNYERAERGEIFLGTEPFAGFWEGANSLLDQNVLSLILASSGREFDPVAALKIADQEANTGVMFSMPRERIDRHRPTARVLLGVFAVAILMVLGLILHERRQASSGGSTGSVRARGVPWLMLAPAILSIGLWSYYPLFRGLVMAFQDYRILGGTRWVGLDNFIAVAIDPNTWLYAGKTLKFVMLSMLFGFFTPIVLALLLTEIPRARVFFRTLFFLPQLTSGLVVTLMWAMLYNPTEFGVLNRLLAFVGLPSQTWLQDPFWAMFLCILPGIWAGAGIGSLIYIAALKSFPEDYYEAAAIDGAGFLSRIRHITLPQLMPLIVINFVGSFISSFQSMGSIFLLTFGGPGKETTVLSLAIWKLAYNDLRFSVATTMAWYLGCSLIAFTYLQIRFLRRVEFRRAEEN